MKNHYFILSAIIWSLLALVHTVRAQQSFETLTNRSDVRVDARKHRVMAFYYPWYTLPESNEKQPKHWGEINREHMKISRSTNYPLTGPYDSNDPKIIRRHMKWAKNYGIDTYIVSWWGHNSYPEKPMDDLLDAADQYGVNITAYYESVPGSEQNPTASNAIKDIKKLLKKYADHPAWLRVDGRPVLFVYGRAVQQLGVQSWARVQKALKNTSQSSPILIGDQLNPMSALVFDGIHTYNPVSSMVGKSPDQIGSWAAEAYRSWIDMAERTNRISTVTVIPGYNDTKIRNPGTRLPRYGGNVYSKQWKQVLKSNPDWVLITSFNEWHEGTDIEPSVEYGHRYLEQTKQFASSFRSRPLRDSSISKSPIKQSAYARLRRMMKDVNVGILPNADSAVVPWLISRLKIDPQQVSWQRLVDEQLNPDQFPVLIYAAGEQYKPTVKRKNDVPDALREYMKRGGCLMVLPSGPIPFYYNMNKDTVAHFRMYGLALELGGNDDISGWETPPEDEVLSFIQPEPRLPHVPSSFSFPASGDRRWRPFNPEKLTDKDHHVSLLKLRNQNGAFRGDALTYTELNQSKPQGGKLIYSWFGLLEIKHTEPLLYDLFQFVAEKVK